MGDNTSHDVKVEFVFDHDCPNVEATRRVLRDVLSRGGLPARWTEYRHSDSACPAYAQHSGSPAVFINGRDVHPTGAAGGNCRLYPTDDGRGFSGVPSSALLAKALAAPSEPHATDPAPHCDIAAAGAEGKTCCAGAARKGRWSGLAVLPAILGGFTIPGICPACWPAYLGVLSAAGLGFLLNVKVLLPIMVAALLIALGALAWKARQRHGYLPLALGVVACALVLWGLFQPDNRLIQYSGAGLLLTASIWHSWPKRQPSAQSCPHRHTKAL